MTEPAFLTIPEVLTLLRISRATYYRLVKAGKIHPRRIGLGAHGRIKVPRSEVSVNIPRAEVDAILFQHEY